MCDLNLAHLHFYNWTGLSPIQSPDRPCPHSLTQGEAESGAEMMETRQHSKDLVFSVALEGCYENKDGRREKKGCPPWIKGYWWFRPGPPGPIRWSADCSSAHWSSSPFPLWRLHPPPAAARSTCDGGSALRSLPSVPPCSQHTSEKMLTSIKTCRPP